MQLLRFYTVLGKAFNTTKKGSKTLDNKNVLHPTLLNISVSSTHTFACQELKETYTLFGSDKDMATLYVDYLRF